MKVVFVISSLTSGGAERVLTTLANHWSEKGWDVTILAILSHDSGFYRLHERINLVSLDMRYKNSVLNTFWYFYGIRKVVKELRPNYVISFISAINIYTLIALLGVRQKTIISERNNFDSLKSKFWRSFRRLTYPLSDGLVVLSGYDYEMYPYVDSKQIIFNPLNIKALLNSPFENKEKQILAVGKLTEQKGFERLIHAVSKIDLGAWQVIIIGEGPKHNEFSRLIKNLNLETNVKLVGRKSNVYEYFQKASIFVLSSHWEGFPNVLSEAMAHGCSCVSFDCKTGPSDIIEDGINGYLIPQNDVQALENKIHQLMHDEEQRKKFYSESLKIRDKLNLDKVSKEWEDYLEIVNEAK